MAAQCPVCGEYSPDSTFFCLACGGALHARVAGAAIRPIGAAGPGAALAPGRPVIPTVLALPEAAAPPRRRWRALALWAGVPVVGYLFTILFLVGLMQCIERGGMPGVGLWPIAPIVVGALLAQDAWVNRRIGRGLCGMLVWGAIPWLIAADLSVPWVPLFLLAWLATLYRRNAQRFSVGMRPLGRHQRI